MNTIPTLLESLKHEFIERDQLIETLKLQLAQKDKQITQLQQEVTKLQTKQSTVIPNKLNTWNEYILYVCRDGKQRTAREIFNEIEEMDEKPWSKEAATPSATCSANCGTLFSKGKLYKTNDTPIKYFRLLS